MLIWGSTGRTHEVGQGMFHCPSCLQESPYSAKRVSRYFTLYFIPLFPIGTAGDHIQCRNCGREFDARVLSYNTRPAVPPQIAQLAGPGQPPTAHPAPARPAWRCVLCGNQNPGEYSECLRCHAWLCGHCGKENPAEGRECLRCRALRIR